MRHTWDSARGARSSTAGTSSDARPRAPRNSARRARSRGRTPPNRRASGGAPPGSSCASRAPRRHVTAAARADTVAPGPDPEGRATHGSERSRARRDAARGEGGGPRPRGPARHVPQHAAHARDRGARAHPLQAGQDPGLLLHGPRKRGVGRRSRDRDGAERRRDPAPARHGRPRLARDRAVARLRPVHGARRRADGRPRRERPHGRLAARALRHGQPPPGDAARSRSAWGSPS